MSWHTRLVGREYQYCMVSGDGSLQAYVKEKGLWWEWEVRSSPYSMAAQGLEETEKAAKKAAEDYINAGVMGRILQKEEEDPSDPDRIIEGCLAAIALCKDGRQPKQHYVTLAKHLAEVSIRLATRLQAIEHDSLTKKQSQM